MAEILQQFVKQWNRLGDEAASRNMGQCHSVSVEVIPLMISEPSFDSLKWFNYVAFVMIGDLAFDKPFGVVVEAGADIPRLQDTPTSKPEYAPAGQIIHRRGEIVSTLPIIPELMPWAHWIPDPFFKRCRGEG